MAVLEVTLVVLVIILFAALIRSTFGFGDALTAMPLLTLFISLQVATPLVALMSFTISICILARCWRDVVFSSAWKLIIATIIGIPIGLFYLKGSYDEVLKIVLALVILSFSFYKLAKPKMMRLRTERASWPFGFAAGILGGAYNTNGPPVIIYGTMRKWTPAEFRATLQGYFLVTGIFIMLGHWSTDLWTSEMMVLYAICLPFILLSIFLGSRLHKRIPKGRFDAYVYYLLIAVSLILLIQTAWNMVA
jgi:uncharacterized membrane protein YfcA